jgi:hypothetical protein
LSESLTELADAIGALAHRVDDEIFTAVRAQLRDDDGPAAHELEKRLAKVRRNLHKAEILLRVYDGD